MGFEPPKELLSPDSIFTLHNEKDFLQIALAVFCSQFHHNPVYGAFCRAVGREPASVSALTDIPFLPIQFFKTHRVCTGQFEPAVVFESSGTTGASTSRHYVKDAALYKCSFLTAFESAYGPVHGTCIIGLLPSYLERGGSSLVYMVDELIKRSGHPASGFYLHNHGQLRQTLAAQEKVGERTILFGVSYALLDFAETQALPLKNTVVIETGGMKGRRKELLKEELYERLQAAFGLTEIHSEYGMTELLSQAYAVNGLYASPPWMKVLLRDETDPFAYINRTGAVNIIDLANLHSCSFIATDDRGRLHPDGRFEILGRLDNSDVRGCSQMV